MFVAKYMVRGGVVSQNGTTTQNLVQGTSYTLQPSEFSMITEVRPVLLAGVMHTSATVNTLEALTVRQAANGEVCLRVNGMGAPITYSAPTAATVGAASASAVAANAARRYLLLVNTHASNWISLNLVGGAAVLYSGVCLAPNGGSYEMSEAAGNLTTAEIFAIASGAATNMAVQEGV